MIKQVDKKLGIKSWNLLQRFCLTHYGIAMLKRKFHDLIPTPLNALKTITIMDECCSDLIFTTWSCMNYCVFCVGKGYFFPFCYVEYGNTTKSIKTWRNNKVDNNNINQNIRIAYIDYEVVTYTITKFTSISKKNLIIFQ